MVIYDYKIPQFGENKRFLFDGERLYLDLQLGNLVFLNSQGSKELYTATRIELHFPSEHYVTIANQTPRYALEMQIFHNFVSSDKPEMTNQVVKVKKAIVSVLFTIGDNPFGDDFLTQIGISSRFFLILEYNIDPTNNLFITASKNQKLHQKIMITATYDTGFNIKALQGLLNILNANPHMYFYYGSETTPPCREEVLWMVYARPRSLSEDQFKFLKFQLAKHKKNQNVETASDKKDLFGNKRVIQVRLLDYYSCMMIIKEERLSRIYKRLDR